MYSMLFISARQKSYFFKLFVFVRLCEALTLQPVNLDDAFVSGHISDFTHISENQVL